MSLLHILLTLKEKSESYHFEERLFRWLLLDHKSLNWMEDHLALSKHFVREKWHFRAIHIIRHFSDIFYPPSPSSPLYYKKDCHFLTPPPPCLSQNVVCKYININSVVEFQRWWAIKSKILAKNLQNSKEFILKIPTRNVSLSKIEHNFRK